MNDKFDNYWANIQLLLPLKKFLTQYQIWSFWTFTKKFTQYNGYEEKVKKVKFGLYNLVGAYTLICAHNWLHNIKEVGSVISCN